MQKTVPHSSSEPLSEYIDRLLAGGVLLPESPTNLLEVVGALASYGIVLDAYSINLNYIAEHTFLDWFPFFKYFNGEMNVRKLLRHWRHDRINYEYAEYCMRAMLWHRGGGLDAYLDSPEFLERAKAAIAARSRTNPLMVVLNRLFPQYLPEQVRMLSYYSGLGQFWRVMSDIFMDLSDRYDRGELSSIGQLTDLIQAGIVAAAGRPIAYSVVLGGKTCDIIPKSVGLTFLPDTAIPYVESIFFRGTPFFGIVSYNAQAHQIPAEQGDFAYGALYADPLPLGGAGIPPTLLMRDMERHLPDYLHEFYRMSCRGEDDLHVQVGQSFQKSMFCVTTAAIRGLAPHALDTSDPAERAANRAYLAGWMKRLQTSQLISVNQAVTNASCTLYPAEELSGG
nr:CO2 hydration protein [Synechococcus sp. PCC 7336]